MANANVNASQVNASEKQVANLKGMDYVSAHLSEIVGDSKTLKEGLKKSYLSLEKEHTEFNGRLATLTKATDSKVVKELLHSIPFRVNSRAELTHVRVEVADKDGSNVQVHNLLCKMVLVTDTNKPKFWDSKTIADCLGSSKVRKDQIVTIKGYKFSLNEDFVENDLQSYIKHDRKEMRMQEATATDGSKGLIPVKVANEDGEMKPVFDTVEREFYPVLSEIVTPKNFIDAVAKTIDKMWLQLFPTKNTDK